MNQWLSTSASGAAACAASRCTIAIGSFAMKSHSRQQRETGHVRDDVAGGASSLFAHTLTVALAQIALGVEDHHRGRRRRGGGARRGDAR